MGIPFSLLIKPASYNCNLRCVYCFYWCKSQLFGTGSRRMSEETLTALIRNYYQEDMPEYLFAWQGGEPTLMGLDFYRRAVALQSKYLPEGRRFRNAIQTNGTLLDKHWGNFLARKQFLTGISLDGPRELHNKYRFDQNGRGSYRDVMRGLEILRKSRAEFNILTLVSEANHLYPRQIYEHALEHGGFFQQYIECLEFDDKNNYRDFSLKPGQFGEFLCKIFDLWYPRDVGKVSIRHFDSVISRLLTGNATTCPMGCDCRNYFVVEHNGDIFPCDFYVLPELKLGNISDTSFRKAAQSLCYTKFGLAKRPLSPDCESCRYLPLCMGDCQKHRKYAIKSRLCQDWKLFYDHTIQRFENIVQNLSQNAGRNEVTGCRL